jgi:hypothetical protein
MERSVWTDERVDDMVARNETRFELLHAEMRETRAEMREGFREMREELSKVNRNMLHLTIGMIGAFAALFAALVAQSL